MKPLNISAFAVYLYEHHENTVIVDPDHLQHDGEKTLLDVLFEMPEMWSDGLEIYSNNNGDWVVRNDKSLKNHEILMAIFEDRKTVEGTVLWSRLLYLATPEFELQRVYGGPIQGKHIADYLLGIANGSSERDDSPEAYEKERQWLDRMKEVTHELETSFLNALYDMAMLPTGWFGWGRRSMPDEIKPRNFFARWAVSRTGKLNQPWPEATNF